MLWLTHFVAVFCGKNCYLLLLSFLFVEREREREREREERERADQSLEPLSPCRKLLPARIN